MISASARNKAIFGMRYLSRSFSEDYRLADNMQTMQTNKKAPSKAEGAIFLLRAVSLVIDDIAVEKFAADIQNVCELPRVTLQKITA